jgi:alpha-L-rhamnosidase
MSLVVYGLRTEQRCEPLDLDEPRPRLSWKLASERRGAAQTAYRITAAERRADLDDTARLLWDTGRRRSGDGLLVAWDGPVLRSATRYHWRVEVWDEAGAAAGVAESWFETGLFHRADWTAVWIARDPHEHPPVIPPGHDDVAGGDLLPPPLHLRRDFTLDRRPVRARLYATARGVYETRLNDCRIGDQELAPGWTEYHRRLHTSDPTSVREGDEPAAGRPGVLGFEPSAAGATVRLASGRYTFTGPFNTTTATTPGTGSDTGS